MNGEWKTIRYFNTIWMVNGKPLVILIRKKLLEIHSLFLIQKNNKWKSTRYFIFLELDYVAVRKLPVLAFCIAIYYF